MATRQFCIFAPPDVPFDGATWSDTILGQVVRPLVENRHDLQWFWFLRYVEPRDSKSPHFDPDKIPDKFFQNGLGRLVRLRVELPDEHTLALESDAAQLVKQAGCASSDWQDYGAVGELGGDRFFGDNKYTKPSPERAHLVADYLCALSRIVLHAIVGPDEHGRYRPEGNTHSENPHGSSFESLHHLFCNATGVPTTVLICTDGSQNLVRTHWGPPVPQGFHPVAELPIVF